MNMSLHMHRTGMRHSIAQLWQRACAIVAKRVARADAIPEAYSIHAAQHRQTAIHDTQVLRRAVQASFSDEIDWLLCAAILTDPNKRRYCLERALALNPACDLALQALESLPA